MSIIFDHFQKSRSETDPRSAFTISGISHASLLIERGFSAILVSERLGHENVSTTLNVYSHLFPSKHSEVAEKLERLYHYE